jgi:hypothetical protein
MLYQEKSGNSARLCKEMRHLTNRIKIDFKGCPGKEEKPGSFDFRFILSSLQR